MTLGIFPADTAHTAILLGEENHSYFQMASCLFQNTLPTAKHKEFSTRCPANAGLITLAKQSKNSGKEFLNIFIAWRLEIDTSRQTCSATSPLQNAQSYLCCPRQDTYP